ncbi:MAG: histidinol-phosphate transaminase [Candidatus Altiarchaeota archaeon]
MIQPKKAVRRMRPYHPPIEGRRDKLRLDFNENTVGCSPAVVKAIRALKAGDLATYPEYTLFRKKLAKKLGVKFDEVMATNASDEAIKCVMDTYLEPGDEVVLPEPTFAMFRFYAEVAGARIKRVLYNKKDLSFPTKKVLASLTKKTKIAVLVNPNNPTGTPIKKKDIEEIIKKAKKNKTLVLLDEAYSQFSKANNLRFYKKYDNLVIIQTFSKAFGLGGMRIGVIVSRKENIETLQKVNSPYSVNVASVAAAMAALDDGLYVKRYVGEVLKNKKDLEKVLDELGVKYYPSKGNFVLANFGRGSKTIESQLRKKGILVRDRSSDPLLKGCIRMTVGTDRQNRQLIDALKDILKKK